MTDKYQEVIIRYELARAGVRGLKAKRLGLISSCENGGDDEQAGNCLTYAFSEMVDLQKENQGDWYSYEEVLNNLQSEGNICDSCYEAYQIKIGPLADAKQEFGNAKRAIYYAGRKLIKERKND